MKVLMLGWELPPYNSGGLGTACYQLCKSLAKKDIDIEFILPYQAEHNIDFMKITAAQPQGVASIVRSGIAYDSYKYLMENGSSEWFSIYDQQQLYEQAVVDLIEDKEFDIVHAHDWLTFRAAIRIKQIRNCPIILHVHSVESNRAGSSRGNPLVREIEETSLLLADQVIAVSQQTKNRIIEDYNIPADKIVVVHNSIESDEIVPLGPLESDNSYKYLTSMKQAGYRVVVNVGRLTIQKGLPHLLKAAKEVVARAPKTIFLIVGSGEQLHELIELSAELGIGPNVLFADFQRGKTWRDAFAIGDLFVLPSVSEPFGLTPLEAAGYGTPSLVSRQSGISEILNNCLKVDYWDVQEMANKILAVLTNDSLRDVLSLNVMHELQRMSWETASNKIVNLYNNHLVGASL